MSDDLPLGSKRSHDPNAAIEFVTGNNATLIDKHGNAFIDLVSGYSSNNFGHCHPQIVAAVQQQSQRIGHLVGLQNNNADKLRARLSRLFSNAADARVWFATGGARAVEIAWKIAFAVKPGALLHFDLGYHGRSIATSAISATKQLPIAEFASCSAPLDQPLRFPRCDDCPVGKLPRHCNAECFDESFATVVEQADRISAIIVEPAIGARGYYFAPDIFFRRLADHAREHSILLIADEVQVGLGRMGSMIAASLQDWKPDLIVIGKSLAAGVVPISAVLGEARLINTLPAGIESETFAAAPFACGIALAALDLIESEELCNRAEWIGHQYDKNLKPFLSPKIQFDHRGAAIVLKFRSSKVISATQLAEQFAASCVKQKLLVHLTGEYRDRIALIPPLTIDEPTLRLSIERLLQVQTMCETI